MNNLLIIKGDLSMKLVIKSVFAGVLLACSGGLMALENDQDANLISGQNEVQEAARLAEEKWEAAVASMLPVRSSGSVTLDAERLFSAYAHFAKARAAFSELGFSLPEPMNAKGIGDAMMRFALDSEPLANANAYLTVATDYSLPNVMGVVEQFTGQYGRKPENIMKIIRHLGHRVSVGVPITGVMDDVLKDTGLFEPDYEMAMALLRSQEYSYAIKDDLSLKQAKACYE